MVRWTRTLSIMAWKNSGETSAKSCRKNEATRTSRATGGICVSRQRTTSNRTDARSVRPASRATGTRCPVQTASYSACVISSGCAIPGRSTSTLSLPALPSSRNSHHAGRRCRTTVSWTIATRSLYRLVPWQEIPSAARHFRYTQRASISMPDLRRIDVNTL
jgi:hypothetical protein